MDHAGLGHAGPARRPYALGAGPCRARGRDGGGGVQGVGGAEDGDEGGRPAEGDGRVQGERGQADERGAETKETSSRVPSSECTAPTTPSPARARWASATERVRASGPISGTEAPATAPTAASTAVPRPVSAPATRAAVATALTAAAARTTGRCPCRSASRPRTGPKTTWPAERQPPTMPAVAREPLVSDTSRTLPNWDIATGSRAKKERTGRKGPVRAMTLRYVLRVEAT